MWIGIGLFVCWKAEFRRHKLCGTGEIIEHIKTTQLRLKQTILQKFIDLNFVATWPGWLKLFLLPRIARIGQYAAFQWQELTLYDILREYYLRYEVEITTGIHTIRRHFERIKVSVHSIEVMGLVKLDHNVPDDAIIIPAGMEVVYINGRKFFRHQKYHILTWRGVKLPQTDSLYYRTHTLNSSKNGGKHSFLFDETYITWITNVVKVDSNFDILLGQRHLSRQQTQHNYDFANYRKVKFYRKMSVIEKQAILNEEKFRNGGRDIRLWSTPHSGRYVPEYVKDRILGTSVSLLSRIDVFNCDEYVEWY